MGSWDDVFLARPLLLRPFWRHVFRCRSFSAQIVSSPIRCSCTFQLFRVRVWVGQIAPNWCRKGPRRKLVDPGQLECLIRNAVKQNGLLDARIAASTHSCIEPARIIQRQSAQNATRIVKWISHLKLKRLIATSKTQINSNRSVIQKTIEVRFKRSVLA